MGVYVYKQLDLYLELNIPDFVGIHESTALKQLVSGWRGLT